MSNNVVNCDITIQCDDKRLTCAQKLTGASLVYRTGPKTKTNKEKKKEKQKSDMFRTVCKWLRIYGMDVDPL